MSYTARVQWRVLSVAAVALAFALRFATPIVAAAPADVAPPPAPELTSAHSPPTTGGADAPFDLDDDDDDPDDAALPAGIALFIPKPVTRQPYWSVVPLAKKPTLEPLFRPPRRA